LEGAVDIWELPFLVAVYFHSICNLKVLPIAGIKEVFFVSNVEVFERRQERQIHWDFVCGGDGEGTEFGKRTNYWAIAIR
jgi:hypothetical protein